MRTTAMRKVAMVALLCVTLSVGWGVHPKQKELDDEQAASRMTFDKFFQQMFYPYNRDGLRLDIAGDQLPPENLQKHPQTIKRPEGRPTVAIFCGGESYSPRNLWTGLGGSEESVVFMAYALRDVGYHVEVYNNPPPEETGNVGGVFWLFYQTFPFDFAFDVLIGFRGSGEQNGVLPRSKANIKYSWEQDWVSPPRFPGAKFLLLSKIHKTQSAACSALPDSRVHITKDGVNPLVLPEPNNTATRAVYSSSPERGLVELLRVWPRIRQRVPGARLDIYFNQPWWERLNLPYVEGERVMQEVRKVQQKGMKGVYFHGQVGQWELAQAYANAGVWLYPSWNTHQPETCCVTALKAMSLGCYPVTGGQGSVPEVLDKWEFGVRTKGDGMGSWDYKPGPDADSLWRDRDAKIMQDYIEAAVEAMRGPVANKTAVRLEMSNWAKERYSWKKLSSDWQRIFEADCIEKNAASCEGHFALRPMQAGSDGQAVRPRRRRSRRHSEL